MSRPRVWLLRALTGRRGHLYLSTSCLHGRHDYCAAPARADDGCPKSPAKCKFCPAPCVCRCHLTDTSFEGGG